MCSPFVAITYNHLSPSASHNTWFCFCHVIVKCKTQDLRADNFLGRRAELHFDGHLSPRTAEHTYIYIYDDAGSKTKDPLICVCCCWVTKGALSICCC